MTRFLHYIRRTEAVVVPLVSMAPVFSLLWAVWRGHWWGAVWGTAGLGVWWFLAARRANSDRTFQNVKASAMEAVQEARAHLNELSPEDRAETEKLIEEVERELGLREE